MEELLHSQRMVEIDDETKVLLSSTYCGRAVHSCGKLCILLQCEFVFFCNFSIKILRS